MSCNGCRVLRKGCSDTCILRPCLQWIETAEAQGNATVFVAKFFGRAGLMSFISAVPENQRPALFQSLMFEAAGRTVNPVTGAVGLLWTGNWHLCQAAVESVLRGVTLKPVVELLVDGGAGSSDDASECADMFKFRDPGVGPGPNVVKRRRFADETAAESTADLDLSLTPDRSSGGRRRAAWAEKRRPGSPSMNSDESETTTCGDQPRLLNLFN
ncbi:LOB domain-containing protein 37-like [Andrographis paniculata]|uniref:LOB domain-containing protein 37-like n=1 Tax=Andrographis paniculata TaxID=175694 RepID=UPI0021E715AD|nr:LOB domain-containing protein 37-like [Andrographis paniculata]